MVQLDDGLLGATDFTRLLLSFVIIVMVVGIVGVGFVFGLRSQAFLGGILFGIV